MILSSRPRNHQNPRQQINGTVAAALSCRHHPIIRVGAGPIRFVYGLHTPLATADIILLKILSRPFLRPQGFFNALAMILYCQFACASFTFRKPSSMLVDKLNSQIYSICRALLIAKQFSRLPQKRLKNMFGSKIRRKLPLGSRILLASPEDVYRRSLDSIVHFDIRNMK